MALELKWNCTINIQGYAGKNIACDLHMEHLNRECKLSLSGLGSNITEHAVQRVGKCISCTVPILQNFDKQNDVPPQSHFHTRRSSEGDIRKIVKQLSETSQV